jgi:uncharacterized caspase-like protein
MLRLKVFALALLVTTAWSPLAFAQDHPLKGVALVIGESSYETLHTLDNPKRDARAMDDMLDKLGFTVDRVLDADAGKLRQEILNFIDGAKGADVALIYYSGHGIEAGGQDYLVPTDTDLSTPASAGRGLVAVGDVLKRLSTTVPVTIVLLDACRTNSFPQGQLVQLPGTGKPIAVAPTGLEAVRGPTPVALPGVPESSLGMVIGFAASPGQPALDGDPDGNSPYAAALLKHFAAGGYSFGDLMTMVSEEVYLKTKSRQLPWVNSSLRRVLSFGKPVEPTGGDEAAIRDGRRQLLLTIAKAPEATQRYVETVATNEGVPLDALYGMLKVLGVDTSDPTQLEKQLLEGAKKLKGFMAEAPVDTRTDTELVRLSELAQKAQDEGAMDLALKYRAAASARADQLSASLDVTEANLKQDRLQLGTTYADHARLAELNFDFATAAQMWGKAFDQVSKWDEGLARTYKLGQAGALLSDGQHRGDAQTLSAAIDAYKSAEKLVDRGTGDWATTHLALGTAYDALGDLKQDPKMLQTAADTQSQVGDYYRSGSASDEALRAFLAGYGTTMLHLADVTQANVTNTGDPLSEAANAFQQAIRHTDRKAAPLDWARSQSNLGMVLQTLGALHRDPATLKQAAEALNAALEETTRERSPLAWAAVQQELGVTLADLAQIDRGPETVDSLNKAIAAFQAALEVQDRKLVPRDWSKGQSGLGLALAARGIATKSAGDLKQALTALLAAREEQPADKVPHDWAMTTRNIAMIQKRLADAGDDPAAYDEPIENLKEAQDTLKQDAAPVDRAQTLVYLGDAAVARAARSHDAADLRLAHDAYSAAMPTYQQAGASYAASLKQKLQDVDKALGGQ